LRFPLHTARRSTLAYAQRLPSQAASTRFWYSPIKADPRCLRKPITARTDARWSGLEPMTLAEAEAS